VNARTTISLRKVGERKQEVRSDDIQHNFPYINNIINVSVDEKTGNNRVGK
jgi:hypothetical protein